MNIRFSGQYSMARVTAKQFNYINSHKGMQSNLLQGGSRKNLLNYLVNVSGERLTFYNQNRSSSNTLLDAINFFDEAVSADTSFNGYLEAMEEDRQFLNQQYQGLMSTPSLLLRQREISSV